MLTMQEYKDKSEANMATKQKLDPLQRAGKLAGSLGTRRGQGGPNVELRTVDD